MVKHSILPLQRDQLMLALHHWSSRHPKAAIFYINGIQSHAGWLYETAPLFVQNGIDVFVLDRRGTGLSEGMQGDFSTPAELLEDYYSALKYIKKIMPEVPLTLLGQSLGGSLLAGLVSQSDFDIEFDNIVFCASALGKRHLHVKNENMSLELVDIALKDEDYTEEPRYLDFMKKDPFCFRQITQRSFSTLFDIEEIYLTKPGVIANKRSAYLCPESDPLVNLKHSINIFNQLTNNTGVVKSFPTHKHYLWFTDQHPALVQWISDFMV